ncbi:DNA-directed DNA polymerase [Quillaja saponaria]|uniref:DNA-directed DNA polymerase n=1 Tax=Quillaja saponaria TaxID=32244 RepID=A0AAD7PA91_QUISA|nr:DNA-directed DNA polymerase [Quillaja saponaria]
MQYISKTDSIIQSQATSLRNLENQIGQLANAITSNPRGALPSDTIPNPRGRNLNMEDCKAITLRSGKKVEEPPKQAEIPSKQDEEVIVSSKEEIQSPKENTLTYPPLPFSQCLQKPKLDVKFKKCLEVFKKLHINIYFMEALKQMPTFVKFMKNILSKKRKLEDHEMVALIEDCSAILQKKLSPKLKYPGNFHIPISIGKSFSDKALCDLGPSINLIPFSIFQKLGLKKGKIKPTKVTLQLADQYKLV